MNMKKNKIMAVAMLCSTLLSPVSKAHGGTKQNTQKSDTQSDSGKNLQNILNKKSDNPKEMYNSRWKTDDIMKYIKYVLGTIVIGGGLGCGGKKVYNKYIRNPKFELKELEIAKLKEPEIVKFKIEPKKVELTKDSIAEKIKKRLTIISVSNKVSKWIRRVYKQVIESYSQKNNEFQEIIETKIPDDKQDNEQFITWFQELNNEALDILPEGFSEEEKQFAKGNFKFYSFVWVYNHVNFAIAFAPKDKEIDLNGKKGKEAGNFDSKQLFGENNGLEFYNNILKYCGIDE